MEFTIMDILFRHSLQRQMNLEINLYSVSLQKYYQHSILCTIKFIALLCYIIELNISIKKIIYKIFYVCIAILVIFYDLDII